MPIPIERSPPSLEELAQNLAARVAAHGGRHPAEAISGSVGGFKCRARSERSRRHCHLPAEPRPRHPSPRDTGAYVPEMAARMDDDRNLTDGARRCARKVAEYIYIRNREGREADITVSYLMRALGRCRRTVQRYLRQLEREGYIDVFVVPFSWQTAVAVSSKIKSNNVQFYDARIDTLDAMKVDREKVMRAGLALLNEVGLEQLTLRRLGGALNVQAATIYWHFKSKEELIDEMATTVLAEGAHHLVPSRRTAEWAVWVMAFGSGLRRTLLAYRDGARMISGTRLTNTEYMKTVESIASHLVDTGFSVRQTTVLLSTVYNYTLSFVMEEQAVYPTPGKRSPAYDIETRNSRLDPLEFPLLRQSGAILFDKFDRRFKEGLELIVSGAGVRERARGETRISSPSKQHRSR